MMNSVGQSHFKSCMYFFFIKADAYSVSEELKTLFILVCVYIADKIPCTEILYSEPFNCCVCAEFNIP